jgi:hypothetical protein
MPIGEKAWTRARGPRRKFAVRLTATTAALIVAGANETGVTDTAFLTELIERWAERQLTKLEATQ